MLVALLTRCYRDALLSRCVAGFLLRCRYAPEGDRLGNSWRIAGDGTNWGALSNCMNENSKLQEYARPGAWNDPDLLQGVEHRLLFVSHHIHLLMETDLLPRQARDGH